MVFPIARLKKVYALYFAIIMSMVGFMWPY